VASKADPFIKQLEITQHRWDGLDATKRAELLKPFTNSAGNEHLSQMHFELLPEILQLILAMTDMENGELNNLAIKEGYLDYESRKYLHRNACILAIAGSINRGSTATETSAYRRTGTTRWAKLDKNEDDLCY